jgi:hypothetical protein
VRADATITIDADQPNAEILGYPVNYTFTPSNQQFSGTPSWTVRMNDTTYGASAWQTPTALGDNPLKQKLTWTYPSTFELKCVYTYAAAPGLGCPPAADTIVRTVIIAVPDNVIPSNTQQAVAYQPGALVTPDTWAATSQGYYLYFPLTVGSQ